MEKNFDIEQFKKLAAVAGEAEIDEMLDEDIVGAGSSLACVKVTVDITSIVVKATTSFDWCPTSACTPSCRF